jgi:hypothetical protein
MQLFLALFVSCRKLEPGSPTGEWFAASGAFEYNLVASGPPRRPEGPALKHPQIYALFRGQDKGQDTGR